MSNHKNLIFFNKEGDALNFNYNETSDRFEGDILFHENSSDTYKTYGIYTMEKIPSFDFEMTGELTLDKFQLFNEWGLHFYGGSTQSQPIVGIEPVNNDPTFYSKWIYGVNFEVLFPIGSIITFSKSIFEFTNQKRTYNVVATKKNAIMIISEMDNATFESNYKSNYSFAETFYSTNPTNGINTYIYNIKIVNAIGVYNYIDSKYQNNLSNWNEPNFYDKYFINQKLCVVNTENNDGTYTIKETELTDPLAFEYYVTSIPTGDDLIIEYKSKTDTPMVFEGKIQISSDGKLILDELVPDVIKPGTQIRIAGSNLNNNPLIVANVPTFESFSNITYFETNSQVLYNNRIFECIKGYTHSFSTLPTRIVTPLSTNYWRRSLILKVEETTTAENLLNAQIYLTTDTLYFTQPFTQSSVMTLAMAADKYSEEMKSLGVDLYSERGVLRADLIYPSEYAIVNFYHKDKTQKIGSTLRTNERLVEVYENIIPELNYDTNENHRYNIVFTDLDSYGIKVVINKEVYDEEASIIYTGPNIDIERSIDRTLRKWLDRNYLRLKLLGVIAELEYIGNLSSIFFNSIILKSEYPNVPMYINRIEVGSTADFHIEHSRVLFNGTQSIGPMINININGKDYQQQTIYATYSATASYKDPDVSATLDKWVETHGAFLTDLGLIPTNINNLLKFDIKKTDIEFTYTIDSGKLQLPGNSEIVVTKKLKGSFGSLVTSNSATLTKGLTTSFMDAGFATGMAVSVNNTIYPLMNREYNLNYIDDNKMCFSYEGPFWALTDPLCNTSAYVSVAFNSGFGQTACVPTTALGEGSPFDLDQFNNLSFTKYKFGTAYNTDYIAFSSVPGSNNMVDIKYIQLSEMIYVLADNLIAVDAFNFEYEIYIPLNGNSTSIKMEFNEYNNYIYCLSKNDIYIVDPLLNILMSTISIPTLDAADIIINPLNGDIYVSFTNSPIVKVYDWSNTPKATITMPFVCNATGKMVFNSYEEDIYVTTDGGSVVRINGSNLSIQDSYPVSGLTTNDIFYDPVNEAVYVWSNSNMFKVVTGQVVSLTTITAGSTNKTIFNNLTGELNVSNTTGFKSVVLDTDTLSFNESIGDYGQIVLNQYDGMVYMASLTNNAVITINSGNGWVIHSEATNSQATKIIYNPLRKSTWSMIPGSKSLFEVKPSISTSVLPSTTNSIKITDGLFGTLSDEYIKKTNIWLKTREYLRRPRENFSNDVKVNYYWQWIDDQTPEFFIYDFTGSQLEKGTSYSYTGPVPLGDVPLNTKPNRDLTKTSSSQYQQTVFNKVSYGLEYLDSLTDTKPTSSTLETFIGFKSTDEGPKSSTLQLYKEELVEIFITSTSQNQTTVSMHTITENGIKTGVMKINTNSQETFTGKGLKTGQHISLDIFDMSNTTAQFTSYNHGKKFIIRNVYTKTLTLDFLEETDELFEESTVVTNYPIENNTTYLRLKIIVIDREIARFTLFAQTEIEDIRYKINLSNEGKNIGPNEVFIFKDYDILEGGIDWKFLNMKRKEMLLNKHQIYTYIGAYKSIINAINYFGFNDLKLNEYYKNVISGSKEYGRLFKVEIPDIFDNSTPGWTENDFIKHTFPNENYESTNLLNLTYDITDREGSSVLNYSIEEVTIKLQGLKTWLSKNIVPLTHKIQDITGKSNFATANEIDHQMYDIKTFKIREEMTPISFKLNEAYLLPINSGSTVYNCVIDFYSMLDGAGEDRPLYRGNEIRPYPDSNIVLPDYYTIKVRTYRTYKEWMPFETYSKGDRVIYYGKLYESYINVNKMRNPRSNDDVQLWESGREYVVTDIVKYNERTYAKQEVSTSLTTSPLFNNGDGKDWLDITDWFEIDYTPVQTISEYRNTNPAYPTGVSHSTPWPLLPFNFTIDSNLDPFVVIEVSSDNGYGSTYTDRKSYEIRGIKDLMQKQIPIERIGPFQPINLL
jgi:hypothetical protein